MFQSPHLYLAHPTGQQSCLTGDGQNMCFLHTSHTSLSRLGIKRYRPIIAFCLDFCLPGADTLQRSRLVSLGLGRILPYRYKEVLVVRHLLSLGQTLEREQRNDAVSCGSCHVSTALFISRDIPLHSRELRSRTPETGTFASAVD